MITIMYLDAWFAEVTCTIGNSYDNHAGYCYNLEAMGVIGQL